MKKIFLFWSVLFITFSISGCSKVQDNSSSSTTEYLSEHEIPLPEGINMIYDLRESENGDYHILGQKTNEDTLSWCSTDKGETWKKELSLQEELKQSFLINAKYLYDGRVFCMVASEAQVEEMETRFFLVENNGEFQEKDMSYAKENGLNDIVATKEAIFGKNSSGQVCSFDYESGELLEVYEKISTYVNYFSIIDNQMVAIGPDKVETYKLDTKEITDTSKNFKEYLLNDFDRNPNYRSLMSYNEKNNKIYSVSLNGISEYDIAGDKSKQLIYESNHPFNKIDCFLTGIFTIEDRIYISFMDDENIPRAYSYTYQEEGIKIAQDITKLEVFSLERDYVIQDAVNFYNAMQHDIYVEYEYAITGEDVTTKNDALTKLNVELLSGKGPDIIVLDDIATDGYIDRGVLENVSDVLDKKSFFTNITSPFAKQGEIYGIPLFFKLIGVHGEERGVNNIDSLNSFVTNLELIHRENPEKLIIDKWDQFNYIDVIYYAYYQTLFVNNELDSEKLTEFYKNLDKLNSISKFNWTVETTPESEGACNYSYLTVSSNELAETMLELDEFQFAVSGMTGVKDLANTISFCKDRKNVKFDYFRRNGEPIYIPTNILSINQASKNKAAAEEFIRYCVSEDFFSTYKNPITGFPINRTSLEKKLSEAIDSRYSVENSKNESIELQVKNLTKKDKEYFTNMVEGLKEYSVPDVLIKDIIMDQAEKYINGEADLVECVSSATKKVDLYNME